MPREFGIRSYATLLFGPGHQAPPEETWSPASKNRIKAVRLNVAVEEEEAKEKDWLPPGQVKQLAKEQGLEITDEEAEEFLELQKDDHERKRTKPWRTKYYLRIVVAPPKGGITAPLVEAFPPDTPVTVTAKPNKGYEFDKWTGQHSGSDNPTTITLDSDRNVVCHFKKAKMVTLKVNSAPKAGGVVEPPGGEFEPGTVTKIVAMPNPTYKFDKWTGALTGKKNPTTLKMDKNKTVTAHFKKV